MTLTPHPYAELLIAIAEGKQMQIETNDGNLVDVSPDEAIFDLFNSPAKLSIKPEPPPTMVINGHVVPAPMRVAPNQGTTYLMTCLDNPDAPYEVTWRGDNSDFQWLAAGLCQATEKGAIDQAHALLSCLKEPS